ncbi:MAG: response regulator [Nanobdellota archaeon]
MQQINNCIKNKILDYLQSKGFASSSEISKQIGHNRITVTKYLEILLANGVVSVDDVAQARLWRLNKKNNKLNVLVVDDEPSVVDLVALSLAAGKYNVLKAYSGLDALDKVYQEMPDLVVLDLMMPGVDGYEVCSRIKKNPSLQHIPVIILSAKSEVKDKLKGMNLGADDYITKPFDPMEMEARVNTALRKTRKDIDTHPLTKLPGKISCKEKIQQNINNAKDFQVVSFSIQNLPNYKKKHGHRKTNDTLSLIARALSESIKDSPDAFICHTVSDNFILVSADKADRNKLKEAFKKLLPYIYYNEPENQPLELIEKKINKNKSAEKFLELI